VVGDGALVCAGGSVVSISAGEVVISRAALAVPAVVCVAAGMTGGVVPPDAGSPASCVSSELLHDARKAASIKTSTSLVINFISIPS
jgi:hypothetical protein